MSAKDEDWYRRPVRTATEREAFEARLARSRSWTRPHYLRIQAAALREAGDAAQALPLLERAAAEPDRAMLSWVEEDMGHCHHALGNAPGALAAYRRSIAAMEARPGLRSSAPVRFAELVLERSLTDQYEEALGHLADFWDPNPIFPAEEFRQFGLLALLLAGLGKEEEARPPARRALAAAAKTRSGAAKHRDLGLVGADERPLIRALEKLAGAPTPRPPLGDARRLLDHVRSWFDRR